MVVKTLAHAQLIIDSWRKSWAKEGHAYFAFDTETVAKPPWTGKQSALIYDRMQTVIFSACYKGASYSFPTSNKHSQFPTVAEWAELFAELFEDRDVVKVIHNYNYDFMVLVTDFGIPNHKNIWDTMLGCWKSSEWLSKGLKERAPFYGRYLNDTKVIDFTDMVQLAEYAEQDVVQTEEIYLQQQFGSFHRSQQVVRLDERGLPVKTPCRLQTGLIKIDIDTLTDHDKAWLELVEFPNLRSCLRARVEGFPFDVARLRSIRQQMTIEMRSSLRTIYRHAGEIVNPRSAKQLSAVFKRLHIVNPSQTEKGADSFSAESLAKIGAVHPFVGALLAYKSNEKLQSVYIGTRNPTVPGDEDTGLEQYVNPATGCIHSSINSCAAVTGRSSASNPNLQQIPSRKDRFHLRACFVANSSVNIRLGRPRRKLLVLDYAQLEIRIMALYCKDKRMTEVLCDEQGDMHTLTATLFGVDRQVAKQLNFLLLYGGQSYMLSNKLTSEGCPTSQQAAQGYIDTQRQVYPRISEFRKELLEQHRYQGFVQLFTGRRRHIPDIDWNSKRQVHSAETTLSNNVVQGAGQDMLKAAIIRCDPRCINPDAAMLERAPTLTKAHKAYLQEKRRLVEQERAFFKKVGLRFILQVHDEVVMSCEAAAANETCARVAEIMSWRHYFPTTSNYNVPLVAEGGVADDWESAKSKDRYDYHCKVGWSDFNNHV